MRLVLAILFLVIFFIATLPLMLVEFILSKTNRHAMAASSQKIVRFGFRILLLIAGVKRTVIGTENIPVNEPVLYVSNHRSYFDIPVAYLSLPTLTGFMAKKEINRVPFLRVWMRFIQCLFLDRNDIRQGMQTILKGIEQIKAGYSIFISPEGTRNHGEDMLPFKEGSFKMAEKTGCAIIPVAISNSDEIFEKHMPKIKRAHVVLEFCRPIYPDNLDKEERKRIGVYVQGIIREALNRHKAIYEKS
jgi:1-acyl-sn-glycerol-3-phosphate acyltransferase